MGYITILLTFLVIVTLIMQPEALAHLFFQLLRMIPSLAWQISSSFMTALANEAVNFVNDFASTLLVPAPSVPVSIDNVTGTDLPAAAAAHSVVVLPTQPGPWGYVLTSFVTYVVVKSGGLGQWWSSGHMSPIHTKSKHTDASSLSCHMRNEKELCPPFS